MSEVVRELKQSAVRWARQCCQSCQAVAPTACCCTSSAIYRGQPHTSYAEAALKFLSPLLAGGPGAGAVAARPHGALPVPARAAAGQGDPNGEPCCGAPGCRGPRCSCARAPGRWPCTSWSGSAGRRRSVGSRRVFCRRRRAGLAASCPRGCGRGRCGAGCAGCSCAAAMVRIPACRVVAIPCVSCSGMYKRWGWGSESEVRRCNTAPSGRTLASCWA